MSIKSMKPRICYISNFYLGDRRVEIEDHKNDRLLFLKLQIDTLTKYEQSLTKIIFNFNFRPEDFYYLNDIIKLTPKEIKGTPVELRFRENKGMSYGAWSDIFAEYLDYFDYYIFNEDDYFLNDHNWDSYLVKKFNTYKNCGYLCGVVYEGGDNYPKHAANAFGISSFKVLNQIYQKYGRLLGEMDEYTQKHIGGEVHENGQVAHTLVFTEFGYDLYDIREDYKVYHSMGTTDENSFMQIYFAWNNKCLFLPAKLVLDKPFNWYEPWDDQFKLPGLNNKYEEKNTFHH